MPMDVIVNRDPDYLICRYSGQVTARDIHDLIAGMENGKYPADFNILHDFRAADTLDLSGSTSTQLSFRRRATFEDGPARQIQSAVIGANAQIEGRLKIWRATFYGEENHYLMRIFEDHEAAMTWIGAVENT